MFNVTINDLERSQLSRIIESLVRANVTDIEKTETGESNYDISFYCKVACYMKSPFSYLLTINNETMELKKNDFSFISIL